MTDAPPRSENAAPAPEETDQVSIGLGPDLGIYPDELRPVTEPAPAEPSAPEAPSTEPPAPEAADAGAALGSPQEGEEDAQGSRRQRGQDAYQRGLAEGRASAERERAETESRRQADQDAQAATQRVEDLFRALESSDQSQQAWARQGILSLYRGNQQATAIQTTTRQQILTQMAQDFLKLRGADGITDEDYEQLHTAPSAVELAQRALALGRKKRDDEVARLEAELTQLRGRLVGQTATPQPANGLSGGGLGISYEQYINMSPAEARKLTPRQIDTIVADHTREVQALQSGHP